jgi:hypothetical protein
MKVPTIVSCLAKPSGNKGVREPQIVAIVAKSAYADFALRGAVSNRLGYG